MVSFSFYFAKDFFSENVVLSLASYILF